MRVHPLPPPPYPSPSLSVLPRLPPSRPPFRADVGRCTKIINAGQEDAKYMINIRQYAKFVVALGDKVSPTDIDEGMRVGCGREK